MLNDMVAALARAIAALPEPERIEALNAARTALHEVCPFRSEPVDLVLWVPIAEVHANDYNPNKVAPPEMKLLARSISADGYTQPIVGFREDSGQIEVVDGFHRHRVGREVLEVASRIRGYLPVVAIKNDRIDRADRMASTIRHNRARGKHVVELDTNIVIDLSRRGKSDEWIASELGMDMDEVVRRKQTSGLAELFRDHKFSHAWEMEEDDG